LKPSPDSFALFRITAARGKRRTTTNLPHLRSYAEDKSQVERFDWL
jgi:hypothetical protein